MRVVVAVLLLAAGAAFVVLLRTGSGTAAESSSNPGVMIECAGATGAAADCATWGDEILAAGPPSTTFEMEDVVRLRLDRPLLGFATTCTAEYYVSRYPDEPIWDEAVECRR